MRKISLLGLFFLDKIGGKMWWKSRENSMTKKIKKKFYKVLVIKEKVVSLHSEKS